MIEELVNGRLLLRSGHMGRDALDKLDAMRHDGRFVDVALVAADGDGEPVFRAHRLVLSLCSPYFEAMFARGCFAEGGQEEVRIKGVSPWALEALLTFFYTGLLRVDDPARCCQLLEAADLLLLSQTKAALARYLQQTLSVGTAVSCKRLAERHCLPGLGGSADRFLRRNFEYVVAAGDAASGLSDLTRAELRELLAAGNLFCRTEDAAARAAAQWAAAGGENMEHLGEMLGLVDLAALSEECRGELRQLGCDLNVDATGPRRTRRSRSCGRLVVAAGFDSRTIEYWDPDDPGGGWAALTEVPGLRYGLSGAGLAADGSKVLVTGGVGRGGILGAVDRFLVYDLRTNAWGEGPPMASARKSHSCGVFSDPGGGGSYLYVAGGTDEQRAVLGVERIRLDDLSLTHSKWEKLAELGEWLNGKNILQLATNPGSLYCLSTYGANNDKLYDTSENSWGRIPALEDRSERDRPGVAKYGEETIAVAGGAEGKRLLNTVEAYDARSGAWRRLPGLKVAREGPGLVAVPGGDGDGRAAPLLLAVGGRGSGGTVEAFDGREWRLMGGGGKLVGDEEYSVAVVER